jgi:hypothetical protein
MEGGNVEKRLKDQYLQNSGDGDRQGGKRKDSMKKMAVWKLG